MNIRYNFLKTSLLIVFTTGLVSIYLIQTSQLIILAIIWPVILLCIFCYYRIQKLKRKVFHLEAKQRKDYEFIKSITKKRIKSQKIKQLKKISELYQFAEFGKLSAGLFHNLSNHLTALSLNLEQLDDKNLEKLSKAKSHIGSAIGEAKKLEDFIVAVRNQIKNQGKIIDFTLIKAIEEAITILAYEASKVEATFEFNPSADIKLTGDPVKFNQMIINLIGNAIDSYQGIKHDHRKIIIETFQQDNLICFSIEDFGQGIPENIMNQIFEPFFTTKNKKGTGIGLSLSKSIVEKDYNGRIKVKSELDRGTKFIVKLPMNNKVLSKNA